MDIRTPQEIGLAIRERRRKLGLDQEELAARVNVSRQWIIEIEKGKPRAELGLVLRTLNALNLVTSIDTGEADKRREEFGFSDEGAGFREDSVPARKNVSAPDIDAILDNLRSGS